MSPQDRPRTQSPGRKPLDPRWAALIGEAPARPSRQEADSADRLLKARICAASSLLCCLAIVGVAWLRHSGCNFLFSMVAPFIMGALGVLALPAGLAAAWFRLRVWLWYLPLVLALGVLLMWLLRSPMTCG